MDSNVIPWTDETLSVYLECCYDTQRLVEWAHQEGLHNHPLVIDRLQMLNNNDQVSFK